MFFSQLVHLLRPAFDIIEHSRSPHSVLCQGTRMKDQQGHDQEFINIVISDETHRRLAALPIAVHAESNAVSNADGSVSIPITPTLLSELQAVDQDPDTAIQLLLGAGVLLSRTG